MLDVLIKTSLLLESLAIHAMVALGKPSALQAILMAVVKSLESEFNRLLMSLSFGIVIVIVFSIAERSSRAVTVLPGRSGS